MTNPTPRPNPYPGPRSFQKGEKLYGRQRETWELLDLLIAERIVLLYSPSGAGKTSLIQAALLPELEAEGFRVLPLMRPSLEADETGITPVNRYVLSLLLSLEEDLAKEQQTPLAELADMTLADYLDQHPGGDEEEWSGDVLIFDQFEEILTVDPTDREAKIAFFEQVGQALRDRNRWALFSMREEFVAGLDPYLRPIPTRFATTYRLELLGPAAAREAMQGPAADQDPSVTFTDAAAAKLADDLRTVRVQQPDGGMAETLGQHVEPVQLQVVCRRLWDKSGVLDDGVIDVDDLAGIGDVDEALRGYYADTVVNVAGETQVRERAIREWVDRQLITEGGIRGQVLMGEEQSQGLSNKAVWPLVDTHLVRAEQRRGATWFELAHDRLIEPVQADNAEWFDAHLSTLQRQAALWQREGRPAGLLLQDEALLEAEQWTEGHAGELEPHEIDFLTACQEHRSQLEREQRQVKWIQQLAIVSSVIAILAIAASVFAWQSWRRATEQTSLALSRELAADSIANLDIDPEQSVLLSLQALAKADTVEAEQSLQQAVQSARLQMNLLGHTGSVYDVAFDAAGKRIATSSGDGTVKLWDAASGQVIDTLSGHTDTVYGVAFSPDGTRLASAGRDGLSIIWQLANESGMVSDTNKMILGAADSQGHDDWVLDIAFSPNGDLVAAASRDGSIIIWDADSGEAIHTLRSEDRNPVWAIDFSPDGMLLASASGHENPQMSGGVARLWDVTIGEEVSTLAGHTDTVVAVDFSPDGTRLATGSWDKTAKIWQISPDPEDRHVPGQLISTLIGHSNWVRDVAFSPDNNLLATSSWDRTAKLWAVESGRELATLNGHKGWLLGIDYSPDGNLLATAGEDNVAKVWNVSPGQGLLMLSPHDGFSVEAIAYSPDGSMVATGGGDGTVRIWDTATGLEIQQFSNHLPVRDVAFSPDGSQIASASNDRTAVVWDVATGEEIFRTQDGHSSSVIGVAFSPDGSRLATAGADFYAFVWDIASGEKILELEKHGGRVNSVDFSPDGTRLVTASGDGTARIWDVHSGELLHMLDSEDAQLYDARFSPDGSHVATASVDQLVHLWDSDTGTELLSLSDHIDRVQRVAFSPNGERLATASWDGTVKVWDTESGEILLTLDGHDDKVMDLTFSPDSERLATASEDTTVRFFVLDLAELEILARDRIISPMSPEQCEDYYLKEHCNSES